MMKTFSLLPRKTAHPPLVGKTARTCTSITVLFIAQTVRGRTGKTSCAHDAPHPSPASYASDEDFRATGLNVLHAD
jgi:hypothetical protein